MLGVDMYFITIVTRAGRQTHVPPDVPQEVRLPRHRVLTYSNATRDGACYCAQSVSHYHPRKLGDKDGLYGEKLWRVASPCIC